MDLNIFVKNVYIILLSPAYTVLSINEYTPFEK